MSLLDKTIVRLLPAVPRPVVRRLSARYIAGPELADARRVVATLNAQGKLATVDVLGEEITRPDEAEAITQAYLDFLDVIDEDGLDANVSVKLSGIGLSLDPELARANLEAIAAPRHLRPDRHGGLVARPTRRLRSTATCVLPAPRTWASSCRPRSSARSTTRPLLPAPTSGSARGSTSSRPSSPTGTSMRCGRTT